MLSSQKKKKRQRPGNSIGAAAASASLDDNEEGSNNEGQIQSLAHVNRYVQVWRVVLLQSLKKSKSRAPQGINDENEEPCSVSSSGIASILSNSLHEPRDLWMWLSGAPSAECSVSTLLNKTHLVGLLLARHAATCSRGQRDPGSLDEIIGSQFPLLCLFPHRILSYTLRELRDSLQNIQLHWNTCNAIEIANIEKAIDALFIRFGELASRCWPIEILDDQVFCVCVCYLIHANLFFMLTNSIPGKH